MQRYIIRRTLALFPIFLGIMIFLFIMVNLGPEGFTALKEKAMLNPLDYARIQANYGLDDPLPIRFIKWFKKALQFNLGMSNKNLRSVREIIFEQLPYTLQLMGISLILAIIISLLLGIISAIRQYSKLDYLVSFFAFAGLSMPEFWLATMLVLVFGYQLDWLPRMGLYSLRATHVTFWDRVIHLILPVASVTLPSVGMWTRYIRSSILEVIRADYIRTAWSKGLKPKAILLKHVMRNALIPLVTLLGLTIPRLIVGAFFVETIFLLPGLGKIGVQAIRYRDTEIILGINLLVTILVLFCNFLVDISYILIDPRIKYN
ncbi:MAG: ABC transporter permease [Desulfobacterales bacterium]|nr:ABC transporter permease [Desulfobacterales bacterium]